MVKGLEKRFGILTWRFSPEEESKFCETDMLALGFTTSKAFSLLCFITVANAFAFGVERDSDTCNHTVLRSQNPDCYTFVKHNFQE